MAEHTPGLWLARKGIDPVWVIGPVDVEEGPYIIAQTVGGNDEANAHFIAAAPQMLEALEAILETSRLANAEATGIMTQVTATIGMTAQTAIKAARGEP